MNNLRSLGMALLVAVCGPDSRASDPIVRAVGYVNATLSPGLNLITKPLIDPPSQRVADQFQDPPEGATIYTLVSGVFMANRFEQGQWERPDDILEVGRGFFMVNPTERIWTVTFVGEIPQGNLTNTIPAGLSIRSSLVPQQGDLPSLYLDLNPFDQVYLLQSGELEVFTQLPDHQWSPAKPSVDVAEAFLVNAAQPVDWVRYFNVNAGRQSAFGLSPFALSSLRLEASAIAPAQFGAEGRVNFANAGAQFRAPVTFAGSNLGVTGSAWRAVLLYLSGTEFVAVGEPVPFESGASAGYFFGQSRTIAGTLPGDPATFKVRVLHGDETVVESAPVTVTLGGGIVPPADLVGLESLEVPAPLLLAARKNGNGTTLSWPATAAGTLEVTHGFPPQWQPFPAVLATNGGTISVEVPFSDDRSFFRLAGVP